MHYFKDKKGMNFQKSQPKDDHHISFKEKKNA